MINCNVCEVLCSFHVVVGWVPKTFVSSRSQRFDDDTQQKPEDFMDEEVGAVMTLIIICSVIIV